MISLLFWLILALITCAGVLWYIVDQKELSDYYDRMNEIFKEGRKK